MNRGPWTDAEEAILRDLWPDRTIATIATRLGRNATSVRDKLKALGLASNKQPKSIRPVEIMPEAEPIPPARLCQYPEEGRFCLEPVQTGSPYCPEHHARCYVRKVDAA